MMMRGFSATALRLRSRFRSGSGEIEADLKEPFEGLTKAAAHGFARKWDDVAGDFGDPLPCGEREPAGIDR